MMVWDKILDGLRNLMDDYTDWLNKEELKKKNQQNFKSENSIPQNFGYYISINKSKVNLAPQHWIKDKLLQMKENYITKLKIEKIKSFK